MKASTEQHIKFKTLQLRMGLPLWQAKGLLESIWNLCASSSPRGDIGKYSNEEICACIEWTGDPDVLIGSLIDTGWIDICSENRLVIHNWYIHCPTYIKGNLAKHHKQFAATKQPTKQPTKQGAQQGANSTLLPILSYPNLSYPNLSIPTKETAPVEEILKKLPREETAKKKSRATL